MSNYIFTNEINSRTVHGIYTDVYRIRKRSLVTLDFSSLTFIDPEGCNFVMMLLLWLKENNSKMVVKLPYRQDAFTFFLDTGLFSLFKAFGVKMIRQYSLFDSHGIGRSYSYNKSQAGSGKYIPYFKSFYLGENNLRNFYSTFNEDNSVIATNAKLFSRATKCLTEMINNLAQHSETPDGSITINFQNAGKQKIPYLFICVTDFGIGIKKSLLKSSLFQSRKLRYQDDEFFINAALQPGVSSTEQNGRGAGLTIVFNKSDKLIVSSGKCRVTIDKKGGDYMVVDKYKKKDIPLFRGTSIVSIIKNNVE